MVEKGKEEDGHDPEKTPRHGGLEAGPMDRVEHDRAPWEKSVDALMALRGREETLGMDQLRLGIEDMGVDHYDCLSDYERWMRVMTNIHCFQGASVEIMNGSCQEVFHEKEFGNI